MQIIVIIFYIYVYNDELSSKQATGGQGKDGSSAGEPTTPQSHQPVSKHAFAASLTLSLVLSMQSVLY